MLRDGHPGRRCRQIYFWAPVVIFVAVAGGIGLFEYGQYLKDEQRSSEDRNAFAVMVMGNPSYGLQEAERRLMDGHIEFSFYRDLVEAALSRSEYQVRNSAYQSIHRVVASGRTYGERLKKWLPSLPAEVFITTSDKDAAQDVEEKLKRRDTNVVIQENGKPVSKTQVFCYDQDVCKQTAPSVINVLREAGYEVDQAKLSDGSAASPNRIDVQLAEVKASKPVKPAKKPVVKAHHPKEASPGLVAQE